MARDNQYMMTALFPDRESVERAYAVLSARGYGRDDVSVLISDEGRARHFPNPEDRNTELGSKAAEGAGVGAVAGGTLNWLMKTEDAFAQKPLGFFLQSAAGPAISAGGVLMSIGVLMAL